MKKVKVAYVRTQFWFGLDFGGSVSHTSGVLKGFKDNGCELKVFSNEHFFGIKEYNHDVIKPLVFNKESSDIGELSYNFCYQKKYPKSKSCWYCYLHK